MAKTQIHISKNPSAFGGIFCLQLLLSFLLIIPGTGFSQAKAEVENPKINFGTVKKGTPVENVYKVINKGNEPLILSSTEVSCSCTTVDYPKQPIAPGQKAEIVVKFSTESAYGRQDRIVLVYSNDPKSPFKLRFKGVVSKN